MFHSSTIKPQRMDLWPLHIYNRSMQLSEFRKAGSRSTVHRVNFEHNYCKNCRQIMIEFYIFDLTHLFSTIWEPLTHCANIKKNLDPWEYPLFGGTLWRNSALLRLWKQNQLGIFWLGEIRLATGTRGSIGVYTKGQVHWCFLFRPLLALKTIHNLIDFWGSLKF